MYYLIETEYVGPNKRDSGGSIIGDSQMMHISTEPWKTNQSHEPRVHGWLGTTNDNCATAHGEFETLEAARAAAHEAGFTEEYKSTNDDYDDGTTVEQWISPEAARAQWDAGDWFINSLGHDGTVSAYGITAETNDEELAELVAHARDEARKDDVELHDTLDLFTQLRDELRAATDE